VNDFDLLMVHGYQWFIFGEWLLMMINWSIYMRNDGEPIVAYSFLKW
jgi:hypothetical protein